MKELNGRQLVGFIKAGQARRSRSLRDAGIQPKLVIFYDNDSPVIAKYMEKKQPVIFRKMQEKNLISIVSDVYDEVTQAHVLLVQS